MVAMLDITLLRTFLAVIHERQFTAAGTALGISQSTVSQHIRRLELACGRQLLDRDTHMVRLTTDGAVLADLARGIVEMNQRAVDYFAGTAPRGRVRLGISEDLTLTRFSVLLREIGRSHPMLSIELTVGLTSTLYQKLDSGWLDLVFTKRPIDDGRGQAVHRERLMWIAHEEFELNLSEPVPLVLYPSSSITSTMAMETLNAAGRPWFVACASESLSGLRAGASAGLGVMAQSPLLVSEPGSGLIEVGKHAGLPELREVEFVVLGRSTHMTGAPRALADLIVEKGRSLWQTG
jgi:DNA-binding transcriptional LysR family regulator